MHRKKQVATEHNKGRQSTMKADRDMNNALVHIVLQFSDIAWRLKHPNGTLWTLIKKYGVLIMKYGVLIHELWNTIIRKYYMNNYLHMR